MLTTLAPAKINLFLEVLGKRGDGFHDLESVFLAVDLVDRLSAIPAPAGDTTLACSDPKVPIDGNNLIIKAANLLTRHRRINQGISFTLDKNIPMGGGLGGGSSNAAAALRLADTMWHSGLDSEEMLGLAGELGSDVPFFLTGGMCLVRGRGETVEPLSSFPETVPLGLAVSSIHCDTAAAFRGVRLPGEGERRRADAFLAAIRSADAAAMADAAFNRFEETVFDAFPVLDAMRRRLAEAAGIEARLSGSGSTLWFFGDADAAARRLAKDDEWQRLARGHGAAIRAVRPFVDTGIREMKG